MPWSVEDIGEGTYAIIYTNKRVSRTAFHAFTLKDAETLMEAMETYELWKGGMPKELEIARAKPGRKR